MASGAFGVVRVLGSAARCSAVCALRLALGCVDAMVGQYGSFMRAMLTATKTSELPEAMWLLLTLTRIPDGTSPRALPCPHLR